MAHTILQFFFVSEDCELKVRISSHRDVEMVAKEAHFLLKRSIT